MTILSLGITLFQLFKGGNFVLNIYGVISANFSKEFLCGSILLSKNLKNSLLVDSYNGFRNLDILTGITDSIYDINDFLTMGEDVIRKTKTLIIFPHLILRKYLILILKSLIKNSMN